MRFTSTAALVAALATSTVANTISATSDLDGSVWEKLKPVKGRGFTPRNRPYRRQSGWSPPSDMSGALTEVWDHCKETYNSGDIFGFKNYGWDQLIANEGTVNMCVRWESTVSVTAAERTKIATVVEQQYQKWFEWLYGYDGFPYSSIKVNVVGWAVSDKSLLEGDTTGLNIYTDKDADGIPQCAESCGRYFHQDGDYSSCAAGADNHYDQSLWLTEGLSGGTGGDWGQRIGREYFMQLLDSANVHILLHEMGHTFGLDDFYDWTPTGQSAFIMLAGSATEITDFDGWMLRNWWYEISRERGWNDGTGSSSGTASSTPSATSAAVSPTSQNAAPVETSSPAETPAFALIDEENASPTGAVSEEAQATPTEPAATPTGTPTSGQWQQCGRNNWRGASM